jgi:hypothetical protein
MVLLAPMTLPPAFGLTDLADRWGMSKPAAAAWTKSEGFPQAQRINRERQEVFDQGEVIAWEEARRAAGQPVPGASGRGKRGPDWAPRRRRGAGKAPDGEPGSEGVQA